jgi:hypothetical protein
VTALIGGNGPEDRLAELLGQCTKRDGHQAAADSRPPLVRGDGNGVELTESGSDRVTARTDADETDDQSVAFGDPPTLRSGGEIARPARDPLVDTSACPLELFSFGPLYA